MLFVRFSKLLSKNFGINWSLCNFILPLKGSKDGDLGKLPQMLKIMIVFFSNGQFNEEFLFFNHFYIWVAYFYVYVTA